MVHGDSTTTKEEVSSSLCLYSSWGSTGVVVISVSILVFVVSIAWVVGDDVEEEEKEEDGWVGFG